LHLNLKKKQTGSTLQLFCIKASQYRLHEQPTANNYADATHYLYESFQQTRTEVTDKKISQLISVSAAYKIPVKIYSNASLLSNESCRSVQYMTTKIRQEEWR
jgi:hypothetical protein